MTERLAKPRRWQPKTLYVAPGGLDTNSGSVTKPFATITHASDLAYAGDTIYVRGGLYHEQVRVRNSGSQGSPLSIAAYPGERPIVDGAYLLPAERDVRCDPREACRCFNYGALVSVEGSYVTVTGLDVRRSRGRGIRLWPGSHNTVIGCSVHDSRNVGVLVIESDSSSVIASDIWMSGAFAPYAREPEEADWPGALVVEQCSDVMLERNTVHENWGEGILLMSVERVGVLGNIAYDNYAANIYTDHSSFVTIERNLVYSSNSEPFLRSGNPPPGIGFADEPWLSGTLGSHYTVVNNLVAGCSQNLFFWNAGQPGSGLRDTLIAHNTLVNATANPGKASASALAIGPGDHKNTRITNNIITQGSFTIAEVASAAGLSFSHNLWSRLPPAVVQGAGDAIGDPRLPMAGSIAAGALQSTWFRPQGGSPCIGAGDPAVGVRTDYDGIDRASPPSIGAHEYIA